MHTHMHTYIQVTNFSYGPSAWSCQENSHAPRKRTWEALRNWEIPVPFSLRSILDLCFCTYLHLPCSLSSQIVSLTTADDECSTFLSLHVLSIWVLCNPILWWDNVTEPGWELSNKIVTHGRAGQGWPGCLLKTL